MLQLKSTKRILFGLLASLSISLLCWHGPAVAGEMPFSQGLLFKITAPGKPVSYLFGTIHSDDERVLDLPDEVDQAFLEAATLYVEIDMGAANLMTAMTALFIDDGRELPRILGASLYQQAVEAVAVLGVPEVAVRYYKPWALAMMLSMPAAKSGQFMDLVLYQRAVQLNKKVAGLETVKEQLDLFDTLSEDDQITFLRETLNNFEQMPTLFQALLENYLKRDLKALMALNEQLSQAGDPELGKRLQSRVVDQRNLRMVDRLQEPLAEGGLFVAVGALHLPGEKGILRLLEQRGYQVVRLY